MFLNQGSRLRIQSLSNYVNYGSNHLSLDMVSNAYRMHKYNFYFYVSKNETTAIEITYTKDLEKYLTEINYLGI